MAAASRLSQASHGSKASIPAVWHAPEAIDHFVRSAIDARPELTREVNSRDDMPGTIGREWIDPNGRPGRRRFAMWRLLLSAAALTATAAAHAQPVRLTDVQMGRISAGDGAATGDRPLLEGQGAIGSGNGNGNGNIGSFNGNGNTGNFNGNANAGSGNGNGNLGSFQGNGNAGNGNGNGSLGGLNAGASFGGMTGAAGNIGAADGAASAGLGSGALNGPGAGIGMGMGMGNIGALAESLRGSMGGSLAGPFASAPRLGQPR